MIAKFIAGLIVVLQQLIAAQVIVLARRFIFWLIDRTGFHLGRRRQATEQKPVTEMPDGDLN